RADGHRAAAQRRQPGVARLLAPAQRSEGTCVRVPDHRPGGGGGRRRPGHPGRPVPQPADHQPRRSDADEALTESGAAMDFSLRLIPMLPFLGALVLFLFGRKWSRDTVFIVAALAVGAACMLSIDAFFTALPHAPSSGLTDVVMTWIATGTLH